MLRRASFRSPLALVAVFTVGANVAVACAERVWPPPAASTRPAPSAGEMRRPATPHANDAAEATVRFVAMGDTGKGCASPDDGQCRVATAVQAKCAKDGCDFVVLLGDNIYDSGAESPDDPAFVTKFEQPYAAIDLPFYAILGNHDYGSGGAGLEYDKAEHEIAYTARSKKWRMPARFYRVRVGAVELFATDTQQALLGNDHEQRESMKEWLASSSAPWKIALGHHPYRSNGPHGNAGNYDGLGFLPRALAAAGRGVKTFVEDVVCGRADLYLAGHDHSRQWLAEPCAGTELIVSGAGAAPTGLGGSNPTRFERGTAGFLYARATARTLVAEMVDARGVVELTRTLEK